MSTLTVALDLPRALDVPRVQLESRLRELFREGRISSGKGAELLGVSPPSIPPKGREVGRFSPRWRELEGGRRVISGIAGAPTY